MQAQGQLITLRAGADAKAVIAPELGGWLLRYMRHLPGHGFVDGLYLSQEVVDRYPNQMYAGMPLLFPMVSYNHLPNQPDHYAWEGKEYKLPQHGFARRSRWKVMEVQDNETTLEFRQTAETLAAYPFSFRFTLTYKLEDSRLFFRQKIENQGSTAMPFSSGVHPYFPVPMASGSKRSECSVELPAAETVLPSDDWKSWRTETRDPSALSVREDVSGTLFLTNLSKQEVALVDRHSDLKITLNFEESPAHRFLALWSKSTDAPFYCIEPWTALPNSFNRGSELLLLKPGEVVESGMWLSISST
jgi:galactose mutarotase-like enzyme